MQEVLPASSLVRCTLSGFASPSVTHTSLVRVCWGPSIMPVQ